MSFRTLAVAVLLLASTPAIAQQSKSDPAIQALGQMVGEGQQREAQCLAQVYTLRAQVADLSAQVAAEKKRADDAEAKLAKPAAPTP